MAKRGNTWKRLGAVLGAGFLTAAQAGPWAAQAAQMEAQASPLEQMETQASPAEAPLEQREAQASPAEQGGMESVSPAEAQAGNGVARSAESPGSAESSGSAESPRSAESPGSVESPRKLWIESGLLGMYGENGGWVRDKDGSYFYLRPMSGSTVLSVPSIMQKPELPTGCESVALTILLHYWGYDTLGKSEIADHYLTYDATDFVTSFVGDPHTENGAGIFAPGLTAAASRFLRDKGDSRAARDLTGTSFEGLLAYVSQGDPVVVWNTINMQEPGEINAHYYYQGRTYNFYKEEHCMVLCGYDLAQGKVLVSDPQAGLVWRDMDTFSSIYEKMGSNAMTIQEFPANYQNFLFLLEG